MVAQARGLAFGAATLTLCLLVGRVLPGRLETLSATKLMLVPVALVFAVVAGWLALTNPFRAFVLGFALLGFVKVQPAPVDIVFALLIIGSLATVRSTPTVPPFVAIALGLFVLFTLISMTNAKGMSRAVSFEAITLYMIVLAVWLSFVFTRETWVHAAVKVYIGAAVVSGAFAPLALYLHVLPRSVFTFDGLRAEGLFKDPNVYSAFLVPAGVIMLEEMVTPRILTWRRRTLILFLAIVSIGVVVAYSRAAWLNYALGAMTLLVVQANRSGGLRNAFRTVFVLLAGGLAGLAVLYVTGSLTFLEERSHLQGYDNQRFSNQDTSVNDMFRHLFGFGPGQTELLRPLSAHSSYVRAAFEQGLPGLTALILVFGGTLFCALVLARRTTEVNGVGTASLLGIWIGLIANSFFIDTLHWRHLWIMAALIWASYTVELNRRESRPRLALVAHA